MIQAALEVLVPKHSKEGRTDLEIIRYRLLTILDVIGIGFATVYTFKFLTLDHPTYWVPMAIYGLVLTGVLWQLRYRNYSTHIYAVQALFGLVILIITLSYMQGSYFNSIIYWYTFAIFAAMIFDGSKMSLFILTQCIAGLLLLFVRFNDINFGVPKNWKYADIKTLYLIDQIGPIITIFVLSYFYQYFREWNKKEIAHTEKELLRNKEILLNKSKTAELGEIAGGIEFEIRAPMEKIDQRIDEINVNLEDGRFDFLTQIENIDREIEHVKNTIDALKLYSRDSSDNSTTEFNIQSAVQRAEPLFSEKLKNLNAKFNSKIHAPHTFIYNEIHFHQVLVNSLSYIIRMDQLFELDLSQIEIITSSKNHVTFEIGLFYPKNRQYRIRTVKEACAIDPGIHSTKKIVAKNGGELTFSKSPEMLLTIIQLVSPRGDKNP